MQICIRRQKRFFTKTVNFWTSPTVSLPFLLAKQNLQIDQSTLLCYKKVISETIRCIFLWKGNSKRQQFRGPNKNENDQPNFFIWNWHGGCLCLVIKQTIYRQGVAVVYLDKALSRWPGGLLFKPWLSQIILWALWVRKLRGCFTSSRISPNSLCELRGCSPIGKKWISSGMEWIVNYHCWII